MVSVPWPLGRPIPAPGSAERLRSFLDVPRLMSLGWDPDSRIWTVDPAQSAFSYRGDQPSAHASRSPAPGHERC